MSELKVYRILGIEFDSQFYHKPEADKVIAHHKYKRCLAMADKLHMEMNEAWRQDNAVWGLHAKIWSDKWRELAEKFKDKEA